MNLKFWKKTEEEKSNVAPAQLDNSTQKINPIEQDPNKDSIQSFQVSASSVAGKPIGQPVDLDAPVVNDSTVNAHLLDAGSADIPDVDLLDNIPDLGIGDTDVTDKKEVSKVDVSKVDVPKTIEKEMKKDKLDSDSDSNSDSDSDEAEIDGPVTEIKTETFYIDLRPRLIKLPPFDHPQSINVRYPVLPPFAFIHIYWDEKANELVYDVEEPILDKSEIELFELIQLGLEEIINISYVKAAKANVLIKYLEKNVQSILIELGAKISLETYKKLMYFIYRNAVGFNEIEALLNDYYVEDIECNGINFPLYIVHRKYQNLRTNVIFKSSQHLTDFVEKLAQKSGRYISYAKPLLDGTLPDGSRVNATYTEDITTRGPTFTIRKFTKEPWTPIHLIQFKTASPEALAFAWIAIEHKFNIMTIGETASGKTTFLNAIATFIPPEARICSIEDTRELNLPHSNWLPAVTRSGFGMPNVLGQQFGEITLFDLLRETFRQAPDYVIVGEVRGEETCVLFQGMASGHPSFATFHAASVPTLVKRLETPPINLSPSLVESLDLVIVCAHVKTPTRNFRRMKELNEIVSVDGALGEVKSNAVFIWDSVKDVFTFNKDSVIFKKITLTTGLTAQQLETELKRRAALLKHLADRDVADFKLFSKVVNDYYKDPVAVLKQFGLVRVVSKAKKPTVAKSNTVKKPINKK